MSCAFRHSAAASLFFGMLMSTETPSAATRRFHSVALRSCSSVSFAFASRSLASIARQAL